MSGTYITKDQDRLDLICYENYGYVNQSVEAVLSQNPGLAEAGELLSAGISIKLPDMPSPRLTLITLW